MKKLFTIVLVLTSLRVVAQEDTLRPAKNEITNRFYVALEAGANFPLADFGDRSLDNPKSGLALTGISTKLRIGYSVLSHFSLVADAFWFYNPLDAKSLLNGITSNQNNPPQYKYKVTTNAWKVYGAMTGTAWKLDLDDTDCELKGMLGIAKGTYANARYSVTDGVRTESIDENADDDISLALNFGITFHLKISNNMAASISGDYFVTQFDFNNVTDTYSDGFVENVGSYTQPVSVFQLSAGVVFRF
jgi:hypothetical protein